MTDCAAFAAYVVGASGAHGIFGVGESMLKSSASDVKVRRRGSVVSSILLHGEVCCIEVRQILEEGVMSFK